MWLELFLNNMARKAVLQACRCLCVSTHSYMACAGVKIPQKAREQLRETLCSILLWLMQRCYILQEHYFWAETNYTAGKFGLSVPEPDLCLPVWVDTPKISRYKTESCWNILSNSRCFTLCPPSCASVYMPSVYVSNTPECSRKWIYFYMMLLRQYQ